MFPNRDGTIGVVDLGTSEQKAKLFQMKELVSAPVAVSLAPTDPVYWKIWPRRNQAQSNTCVFQARAKAAGILNELATGEFVEYSALDYNKRSNASSPSPYDRGAYPVEAFDLWRTDGMGLEVLEASQSKSDAEIAATNQSQFDKGVAKVSLLDGYYALPGYDFDSIVSTLHATKKPIPLGFFGSYEEWNKDVPVLLNPNMSLGEAVVRHEVCGTANYGIYQGQEGFTIEDSWGSTGIGGMGVRFITRAFFSKRNYIPGLVPTKFKSFEDIGVDPAKPKVSLKKDLYFGMTDPDVRSLQSVLKYEGFFPANHSGSDYFGEITKRGVQDFQLAHDLATSVNPGYGRCGPKTREYINQKYK